MTFIVYGLDETLFITTDHEAAYMKGGDKIAVFVDNILTNKPRMGQSIHSFLLIELHKLCEEKGWKLLAY